MTRVRFWLLLLALSVPSTIARAEAPPMAAYAALPAFDKPRLSPDGEALAMIAPVDGRLAVVVRRLDGGKPTVIAFGDTIPNWVMWKSSTRLLISVRAFTPNRDEPVERTRLGLIDADGGNAVTIKLGKPLPASTITMGRPPNQAPQIQDRVLSLLPNDPDHFLMEVTPEDDFIHPQVVSVDVHDGHATVRQLKRPLVADWFADADGAVRVGVEIDRSGLGTKENHRTVIARASADGEWRSIDEGDADHHPRFLPIGFVPGSPSLLTVLMDGAGGRLAARQIDIATGRVAATLAEDAECDVTAIERDFQVVGFQIPCRAEAPRYLDASWQRDQDAVKAALKTEQVTVLDRTADGKRALLSVTPTASAPPALWLLDRRGDRPALRGLGGAYDQIPPDRIAPQRQASFPARDGLTIPVLLTLPVDHPDGPLPFVVLPHGGPTAHDRMGFNWIAQFLTSRGYGVLQPQFRGSTGHGVALQQAGYRQWGLAMQDDITDATHWLVEQKLADPRRICIVGASYGGYAALMGAIKEPGLYACAAAFAPVTDLDDFISRLKWSNFADLNVPRIKGDGQSLAETSPARNADRIRVPVLLMHGRKDFTVPVSQSEAMDQALRRAGKPVEAIYLDGADHYVSASADRLAWLGALDQFLAANLAPATN